MMDCEGGERRRIDRGKMMNCEGGEGRRIDR